MGLSANLDGLGDRSTVYSPPGYTTSEPRQPQVELLFLERFLRNFIEAWTVFGQIRLPAAGVPQLQVIANSEQDNFPFQSREGEEAIRNQNAARLIDVNRFHLGEKQ